MGVTVLLSSKEKLPYPHPSGRDMAAGEGWMEAFARAVDARLAGLSDSINGLQHRMGQIAYLSAPDVAPSNNGGFFFLDATLYDTIGNDLGWNIMETHLNDDPRRRYPEVWHLTCGLYGTWVTETNGASIEFALSAQEEDPVTGAFTTVMYPTQDVVVSGTGGVYMALETLHVSKARTIFNLDLQNFTPADMTVQTAWCSMTRVRDFPG